jgi:hypothetical protein
MKHRVAFHLFVHIALVVGLLGTIKSASAQNNIPVAIPFAFVANHQLMPAGEYNVRLLTPRLMSLADGRTGATKALLLIRPDSDGKVETRGRLIFLHSETGHYLKQVRIAGSRFHSELVVHPSLEGEFAAQPSAAESTVEIAVK